jgi:hypothetical protein
MRLAAIAGVDLGVIGLADGAAAEALRGAGASSSPPNSGPPGEEPAHPARGNTAVARPAARKNRREIVGMSALRRRGTG